MVRFDLITGQTVLDSLSPFRIDRDAAGKTSVRLDANQLADRIGSPRRADRSLGVLNSWEPLRVIVNGRGSSYSGQLYTVADFHLVLCTEPRPPALAEMRVVDLQTDLL